MAKFKTREEWLVACAKLLTPKFKKLGFELPAYRVTVGFPSNGRRGKAIGECWSADASGDHHHEILIRPDRFDALEVAGILAHELSHAAVGLKERHNKKFAALVRAMGLDGKPTATTPGPDFIEWFRNSESKLGDFPHAALDLGVSSGPKKQSTRLLKATCSECGYTVRITKKWATSHGATCPEHGPMEVEGLEAEDGDEGEGEEE